MLNPIKYLWDKVARLFRGPDKQAIPPKAVRQSIDAVADGVGGEIRAASIDLQAGRINESEWAIRVRAILKAGHLAAATAAVGGKARMDTKALGLVGNALAIQYRYLYGFAREIGAGYPLDDRFLARAAMYGQAVRSTYESINRSLDIAAGYDQERRICEGPHPCVGCLGEQSKGWRPAGELLSIGKCECRVRCECRFERRKSGVSPMSDAPKSPEDARKALWDAIAAFGKGGGGKSPGGKSGKSSGGPGGLAGGHWVTIMGHPAYIKDGKVVAGGARGVTHGHDGTPHGPVKHGGSSIPMHGKKAGVHPDIARARADLDKKEKVAKDRKVRKADRDIAKAKADHARAKADLDAHHAAAKESTKALDAKLADAKQRHEKAKADLADHDAKEKARKEAAGAKSGPREMNAAEYAKEHGVSHTEASDHLRKLYQDGKIKAGGRGGSYSIPHDAPKPAAKPAAPKPSKHDDAADKALADAEHARATAKAAKASQQVKDHDASLKAADAAHEARRTVKTSAPRNAREAAVHADAKSRGKSAMVVTKRPTYEHRKVGSVNHHMVGGKTVGTHEFKDGKYHVTIHNGDGSKTKYVHNSRDSAKKHLEHVAGSAVRSGTTHATVVGSKLSDFDHKKHGLSGKHHRTTARLLGDGGHAKFAARPAGHVPNWLARVHLGISDSLAETGETTFGEETMHIEESAVHEVATFDLDAAPEVTPEWVTYPDSLLFRSGDYPAKKFSLTPDELRAAATSFAAPVPNELEHVNSQGIATILDGKLGQVTHVRASEDGSELRGTVVIPKWLDSVWGDGAKKVSCVWDRADKTLRKLGLVIQGHVPDAALMAAFGESVFGDPDESDDPAAFATPRKRADHMTAGWQLIHDICSMIPGVCPGGVAPGPDDGADDAGSPAMMGDLTKQLKHLKMTHDTATEHGAACSGGKVTMSDEPTRSDPMAKVDAKVDAEIETAVVPVEKKVEAPVEAVKFSETAEYKALRAELDAEKAKLTAATGALEVARKRQVEIDGATFAQAEIAAGRAISDEYADLLADFSEAAELDHETGKAVTFSDAAGATVTGSRVDKLRARAARRPAHTLFDPALSDGELPAGSAILFNAKSTVGDEKAARDAADAVHAKTPEGRAYLAKRGK